MVPVWSLAQELAHSIGTAKQKLLVGKDKKKKKFGVPIVTQ